MTSTVRSHLPRRKVPVILVSGVNEAAMGGAAISLQLGLPNSVGVRHIIDVEAQVLTRVVSDASGVIEREEINLAHACVTCAVREDIVPTLERLAKSGRWGSIVACLPVAAEATQVCRVIAFAPSRAPHVNVAAVVTALDGTTVTDDLLGDDLLGERGIATSHEDRRGTGEVACAMVEYADLVTVSARPGIEEAALITALARPRIPLVDDVSTLDAQQLARGIHRHQSAEAWVADVRRGTLPPVPEGGVWRLDLSSDRAFDPMRFQDQLAVLGSGPRRSRGSRWEEPWDGLEPWLGPIDQVA